MLRLMWMDSGDEVIGNNYGNVAYYGIKSAAVRLT